ncbi:MAG: type I DNA topoisomerase [Fidelibacterota bacterium]
MSKKSEHLIIVESPSKAKTLKRFLGDKYLVEASVGHVRDLPSGELGIDTEKDFKPKYVISPDKKKVISALKKAIENAGELYIATDPDREGEAIAWHLLQILKPAIPVKRLVFHEITQKAISEAFNHTRELDNNLVSAQETRRILDRLFGFLVSEKLWYNVKSRLSAGRVQSPAIKIIVDREKLRAAFVESEYWRLTGKFLNNSDLFSTILISLGNQKIARGKDFNAMTGKLSVKNRLVLTEELAQKYASDWLSHTWTVKSVEQKPAVSNPAPPFITSTLQQEGVRKLRLSSKNVMSTAQRLYEGGYITYMRTDSVNLSSEAITAARAIIEQRYGKEYLPKSPRHYKNKVKNAQEAHEAIRPAGSVFRSPEELKGELSDIEWKLYQLIWNRTIASQMTSAKLLATVALITDGNAVFEARGKSIQFHGYLKLYVSGTDEAKSTREDQESLLPALMSGQTVKCKSIDPSKQVTKPAPRFTEASLVKELESLGIGRPSTYASIMELIQKRGYANKVNGALIPTFTAYAVVQFLEEYFTDLVDLQFTAWLEDQLDSISLSQMPAGSFLNDFFYGHGEHPGLKADLEQQYDKNKSRHILELTDDVGNPVLVKIGRYGIYLQNDGQNVTIPDDFVPSELTPDSVAQLFRHKNTEPEILGNFPGNNEPIQLMKGRFGWYLKAGDKMKSLLPGMEPEGVTHDIAIQLLSLPKILGKHDGNDVLVDLGRYGQYIKNGSKNRKITPPDTVLNITLERAVELLNTSGRASTQTLKVLGNDPASGDTIELKSGRYGDYVTDGKVNATLPKGTSADQISLEEAMSLIQARREKGPAKRRYSRKRK